MKKWGFERSEKLLFDKGEKCCPSYKEDDFHGYRASLGNHPSNRENPIAKTPKSRKI